MMMFLNERKEGSFKRDCVGVARFFGCIFPPGANIQPDTAEALARSSWGNLADFWEMVLILWSRVFRTCLCAWSILSSSDPGV